jgi:exosortase
MDDRQRINVTASAGVNSTTGYGSVQNPPMIFWSDRLWKFAIIFILYVFLFRDELLRLIDLWMQPRESHGVLIPLFSLYFIYQDRRRLQNTVGRPSAWGLLVMLLSLAGYLFYVVKGIYYPRQIMMIFMIAGIVLFLGGWPIFRILWLAVGFLIFAMPLPDSIYFTITMPMRQWASDLAAIVLNAMPGVNCESVGVIIQGSHLGVPFKLNVAEACSGMRLLMTFVALGVAMAYLEYRPIVHRLILLFSTAPIAVFCNMLRVLITGLIHIYIGPDYATGTLHNFLGLIMLGVAFGLYGLLAWLMNRMYISDDQDQEGILVVGQSGEPKP